MGDWLMPSLLGIKIIAIGAIRAISYASNGFPRASTCGLLDEPFTPQLRVALLAPCRRRA